MLCDKWCISLRVSLLKASSKTDKVVALMGPSESNKDLKIMALYYHITLHSTWHFICGYVLYFKARFSFILYILSVFSPYICASPKCWRYITYVYCKGKQLSLVSHSHVCHHMICDATSANQLKSVSSPCELAYLKHLLIYNTPPPTTFFSAFRRPQAKMIDDDDRHTNTSVR